MSKLWGGTRPSFSEMVKLHLEMVELCGLKRLAVRSTVQKNLNDRCTETSVSCDSLESQTSFIGRYGFNIVQQKARCCFMTANS